MLDNMKTRPIHHKNQRYCTYMRYTPHIIHLRNSTWKVTKLTHSSLCDIFRHFFQFPFNANVYRFCQTVGLDFFSEMLAEVLDHRI